MKNRDKAFDAFIEDVNNVKPNQTSREIAESLRLKYESDYQEGIRRLESQGRSFYCEICNEINGRESMPHKLHNGEWICTGCFKPQGEY